MPDPVTHLSIGFVVSRHFFSRHKILFLCSCMAPDIDGLVGLLYIFFVLPEGVGKEEMIRVFEVFHPSLPASLLFLPIYPLILWAGFRWVNRNLVPDSFGKAYRLILVGLILHLSIDMLMKGNRPFWPFSFEAGLGIIPVSFLGVIVPMFVGLTILLVDSLVNYFRNLKQH